MKIVSKLTLTFTLAVMANLLTGVHAQTTSTPVPVTPCEQEVRPDLSMLVSHDELTKYSFKRVQGISLHFQLGASVDNYAHQAFFQYTNSVKTLEGAMAVAGQYVWGFDVVDPKAYAGITVKFWDSSDSSVMYSDSSVMYGGEKESDRSLFWGSNGGLPEKNGFGDWELSDKDAAATMWLADNVFIPAKNVVEARIVLNEGKPYGFPLRVKYQEGFWMPSQYAGTGTIVLTTARTCNGGWYWNRHAYDVASNREVPITTVLIQPSLLDSPDFREFKNEFTLSLYVQSWQGYGKVPLIIANYDAKEVNRAYLSLQTDEAWATEFYLEEQNTGTKMTVYVPIGSKGTYVNLPAGSYFITSNLRLNGTGKG